MNRPFHQRTTVLQQEMESILLVNRSNGSILLVKILLLDRSNGSILLLDRSNGIDSSIE